MVTKRKASPKRTNPRKVMPGDHVTKTNPRKVAAGHDPMEKKKIKKATNPKGISYPTLVKPKPKGKTTKTTKLKTKPRGEVIPKLEIEKPHPRKLPVPMPPGLSKKPKKKKTAVKKK